MRHGPQRSTEHVTRRPVSAPGRGSGPAGLGRFPAWLLIWLVVVPGVAFAKLSDREGIAQALAQMERSAPLRVSGHVSGLAPGVGRTLRVRIQNHYSSPVVVTGIRVIVEDASDDCPARALKVSRFRGLKRIPQGRAPRVRLRVWMRATAKAACQGQAFPLLFWLRGRAK
jgi:hypothetical protein